MVYASTRLCNLTLRPTACPTMGLFGLKEIHLWLESILPCLEMEAIHLRLEVVPTGLIPQWQRQHTHVGFSHEKPPASGAKGTESLSAGDGPDKPYSSVGPDHFNKPQSEDRNSQSRTRKMFGYFRWFPGIWTSAGHLLSNPHTWRYLLLDYSR